jgi:hypothetical protein
MGKEKPFWRAGIQEDGSCIKQIGCKANDEWKAAEPGQTLTTLRGPFLVEEVEEIIKVGKRRYFRAKGRLVDKKEK